MNLGTYEGIALNIKHRAPRFEIQMPLRYRLNGEGKWRNGITENISRTGVLFRGEEFAEPNTPLEMSLALPDRIPEARSARVACRGIVVRSQRPGVGEAFPLLASTISHYRLIRPFGKGGDYR
jgi:hypothetical protein